MSLVRTVAMLHNVMALTSIPVSCVGSTRVGQEAGSFGVIFFGASAGLWLKAGVDFSVTLRKVECPVIRMAVAIRIDVGAPRTFRGAFFFGSSEVDAA